MSLWDSTQTLPETKHFGNRFFFWQMKNVKSLISFIPIQLKHKTYVCVHIHMCSYVYICSPTHSFVIELFNKVFLKTSIFCEMWFSLGKLTLQTFLYLFQAEQQPGLKLLGRHFIPVHPKRLKKQCAQFLSQERVINLQVLKNLWNNHFCLS